MVKVNFVLEEEVRDELNKAIPLRKRSKIVNEVIKKELIRLKRQAATEKLFKIRERTAKYKTEQIVEQLKIDRTRTS